jgi:hypothetical protein
MAKPPGTTTTPETETPPSLETFRDTLAKITDCGDDGCLLTAYERAARRQRAERAEPGLAAARAAIDAAEAGDPSQLLDPDVLKIFARLGSSSGTASPTIKPFGRARKATTFSARRYGFARGRNSFSTLRRIKNGDGSSTRSRPPRPSRHDQR